jgi:hypothetical protein
MTSVKSVDGLHGLSQEEMGEVLRRAQEIERQPLLLAGEPSELEQFVQAAEEAGISREATLQALRERLSPPVDQLAEGMLVFAKTERGHFYVGRVLGAEGLTARLMFLSGGEGTVDVRDIRPFSMTPGRHFEAFVWGWWYRVELVRYNHESKAVTVNCWGSEATVPLEKVRLAAERKPRRHAWPTWATTFAAGVATGTGIGAALLYWLTR